MIRYSVVVTKDNFKAIQGQLKTKAGVAVRKAAFDIEAHAKQNAPYDTGNLRNSIQAQPEGDLTWVVGTSVHYAAYQEYGTAHGVPPHPYMVPAAEAVRPSFEAAMKSLF